MAENDDLYKVEQAVRDYESDPDRLTGRVKSGKRMYGFAWVVEIFAATTGLIIAWAIAWQNLELNTVKAEIPIEAGLSEWLGAIRAGLPFVIIAIVEVTKIPLASGFYYAKAFRWKMLFLFAILGLIFVTAETLYNGLETQLYQTETRILNERAKRDDFERQIEDKNQTIITLNNSSPEALQIKYEEERGDIENATNNQLDNLRNNYKERKETLEGDINKLRELAAKGEVEGIIARMQIIEDRMEALRNEERDRIDDIRNATIANISTERELTNETLTSLNDTISTKSAEKESCAQLEDGFFNNRKSACISRIDDDIRALNEQKNTATAQRNQKILTFQTNEASLISQITEDTKLQIKIEEDRLVPLQEEYQERLDSALEGVQDQIDNFNNQLKVLTGTFNEETERINSEKTVQVTGLTQRHTQNMEAAIDKPARISKLEEEIIVLRSNISATEAEETKWAREIQVYRIASLVYAQDDMTKIEREQIRTVTFVWFGSIGFIVAIIGTILALAAFIMQDPQNFRPREPWLRPFIKDFPQSMRNFGNSIGSGIKGISFGFRYLNKSMGITLARLRKRLRNPKIVEVDKIVEVEVEKEIEKIVEKEKIVYKEVPKEIVRKELVYVPFYSAEKGTIDVDPDVISGLATEQVIIKGDKKQVVIKGDTEKVTIEKSDDNNQSEDNNESEDDNPKDDK